MTSAQQTNVIIGVYRITLEMYKGHKRNKAHSFNVGGLSESVLYAFSASDFFSPADRYK